MTTFTLVGGSWALDALGNASDWQATSLKLTVSEDFMLSYTPLSGSATPHLPEAIQLGAAVGTLHNLHVGTDAIDLAPASTAGWTVRAGRMTYTSGNFTDFLILEQDPSAADPLGRVHFFRIGGQGATALTHTGDLSKLSRVTDLSAIPNGAVAPNTSIDLGTIPGIVTSLADSITGTEGADTILGGLGKDWISGLGGHDKLDGGDGGDTILGGSGRDTILGQAHDDLLSDTAGANYIAGGDGQDTITGGLFKDTIFGGNGLDVINGGLGADKISAGGGADTVTGTGEDIVNLGKGNDTYLLDAAYAQRAGDTVDGGKHNDLIDASASTMAVSLIGNTGSDTLYGGSADDTLEGNAGKDSLYAGNGNDSVLGGTGFDYAELGDGDDIYKDVNKGGADTVLAGDGDDTVRTLDGHDLIIASSGNNLIEAGLGQDTIRIGSGNDTAKAGLGNDLIEISGGTLNQIEAGNGADTIVVQGGTSVLNLGLGEDVIRLAFTDTASAGEQRVLDFNLNKDTIDLGPLADITAHWDGISNPFAALLSLEQDGADTLLRADFDGDGTADTTLLRIENRKAEKFTAANFGGYEIVARPVAQDDRFESDPPSATQGYTDLETPVTLSAAEVLANDTDADGDALEIVSVQATSSKGASVTLDLDGNIVYDPTLSAAIQALAFGELLEDTFTYRVSDGNGGSASATVTITVSGVNAVPVANNDTLEGPDAANQFAYIHENSIAQISAAELIGNDTDGDDHTLAISAVDATSSSGATLALEANGDLTYDPTSALAIQALQAGETLVDSFTYTVADGQGGFDTATVSIRVGGLDGNLLVTAMDDTLGSAASPYVDEDSSITITASELLGNDGPVSTLAIQSFDSLSAQGAALTWNGNNISYDPTSATALQALASGETIEDSFTYWVTDGDGEVESATVTLTVGGLTDPVAPEAEDDVLGAPTNIAEFLVNEVTQGTQVHPSITTLGNGHFVVTWMSGDGTEDADSTGIRARIFDSYGSEVASDFLVNEITQSGQFSPTITSLSNNRFMVAWGSSGSTSDSNGSFIHARIFNSDGSEAVSEFQVSGASQPRQVQPNITELSNGQIVVTWQVFEIGQNSSIHARVFNADGSEAVSEFRVNSVDLNGQAKPSIAALDGGQFIVTWESADQTQDTSLSGIRARVFNANGSEAVSEFQVNNLTDNWQGSPSVATLNNGQFVVTWGSLDGKFDKSNDGIRARIFNADGSQAKSEFQVNKVKRFFQKEPSIAVLDNGQFVVTWESYDGFEDTSNYGIRARIFNEDGSEAVPEFLVNDIRYLDQDQSSVTALSDGRFIVTWESASNGSEDTEPSGIRARIFNSDGTPITNNAYTDEDSAVTIDADRLLANDTDANADPLEITSVQSTSTNGATVTLDADGNLIYDPTTAAAIQALADGAFLEDTFTYTVSDGNGGTDTATVTIAVSGLDENTGPVAEDDTLQGTIAIPEFQVNEVTVGDQNEPVTANLGNGQFVVAWHSSDGTDDTSSTGIRARILNSDGSEAVNEFLVNEITQSLQYQPSITVLSTGQFVVSWHSYDQTEDTSSFGVRARIFNADGTPAGDEFLANEALQSDQFRSSVTALSNGRFVVAWQSRDLTDDPQDYGIRARIFNADGSEAVDEFQVNSVLTHSQRYPHIETLSTGQFVVVWSSVDGFEDTDGYGVRAGVFNADGSSAVSEFQVNSEFTSAQLSPTTTALENGRFAIIWHSLDQTEDTSGYGVRARIFNADGSEAVGEFQVNEVANGDQYLASTATLSNGQFVVTWYSGDLTEDTEGFGIRARVFNPDGTEAVSEFQVNEVTTNNQFTPNVTALDNGQFVISWHSTDRTEDTDGHGIRARIFNADGSPATSALAHEDQVTTIDAADLLGNDTDADGDTLVILSVEATSTHGAALSLDVDGNVVYDPTAASTIQALAAGDFLGDSFTYTVSDGQGSTDTATVSLTIAGLDETVGGAEENTDVLSW